MIHQIRQGTGEQRCQDPGGRCGAVLPGHPYILQRHDAGTSQYIPNIYMKITIYIYIPYDI